MVPKIPPTDHDRTGPDTRMATNAVGTDVSAERGYNALGVLVMHELNGRPLAQLARDAGIHPSSLTRWLKRPLDEQFPPMELLQRIADGLDRPLVRIQAAALEAAGHNVAVNARSQEEQLILASLSRVEDEKWRRAICDVVLRMVEEINRPRKFRR